jgi:PEP-CTERM motif
MKTFKTLFGIAAGFGILAVSSTSVFGLNAIITMDENGNAYLTPSQLFPYTIGTDPNSGIATLEYTLPFAGVAGDVLLQEVAGGPLSDVLRFDGNSHVYFFSDNADGVDSLADVGLPTVFSANAAGPFLETGTEGGFQNYMYTPSATGPGAVGNGTVYTFNIISDVPEPGSMLLAGLGGGLMLLLNLKRRIARN